MADFFQKNLQLLAEKAPMLADKLASCNPTENYVVRPAKNGTLTIECRLARGRICYYHSHYNPEEEARRLVEAYYTTHRNEVDDGVFALVFGCGFAYHIEVFLRKVTWLKQLIIFEPDLQLLAIAFRYRDLSWLLGQRNIHLLCGEVTREDLVAIHRSYIFTLSRWAVLEMPQVVQLFPGYVQRSAETFSHYLNTCDAFAMTYMRNGVKMLESRYRNLVHLFSGHLANDVFQCFRGKPFVCVASGPSLNDQLDNLKKIQNNAVIIAADSAVPVLVTQGITPHIVTAFDPIWRKFQYFIDNPDITRHMVLISPLEAYHGLLDVWQGPKLFCVVETLTGACYGNYERTVFPHAKPVFASPTVALASLVFAHQLGARFVVLMGQDLRLYEKSHAQGVLLSKGMTFNEDLTRAVVQKINGSFREIEITATLDYNGNRVPTDKAFSFYQSKFSEYIELQNIEVFNVTRTGARIPGAPRVDFSQIEHLFSEPVKFRSSFDNVRFIEPTSPDVLFRDLRRLQADADSIREYFSDIWQQAQLISGQKERYYILESAIGSVCKQYDQCFQLLSAHVAEDVIAYGKARFINLSRMTESEKYAHLLTNTVKYFQALSGGVAAYRENLATALERIHKAFPQLIVSDL